MQDRETDTDTDTECIDSQSEESPVSTLRDGIQRVMPAPGRIIRLLPLLGLGAVNIAIIFASNAPIIYAVVVALGTLGVAVGVRTSSLSANSGPRRHFAPRLRNPRVFRPKTSRYPSFPRKRETIDHHTSKPWITERRWQAVVQDMRL